VLQPGESIDVWVVEKAIGSGGMGSVYRCHNRHAPRILAAIKTLEGAVRRVPEAEARFVREAEILFSIDHPNVVKVRNVRLDLDTPYIEMEFVEGESLESRLCRGPMPLEHALDVMAQLLDALVYLHERGIRHRDIKPANLLLNKDGRLKLVDFGLASEADVSRITRANTTFGTVSYAPPEWIRPDELDPESWDIYASGVVFWELLTSRVAFPGSPNVDPRQQAVQIMSIKQNHAPLDPGSSYRDDVRALIGEMTQADRTKRLATAREAVRRLRDLDKSLSTPVLTLPPDLPGRTREPSILEVAPTEIARRSDPRPGEPNSGSRKATAPSKPGPNTPMAYMATGGAIAAGFFAVVVIAVGIGWIATGGGGPEVRDVDVVISGVPIGTEVGLRVGNAVPTKVEGFRYSFPAVPVGTTRVRWAVGEECSLDTLGRPVECPGVGCPVWCSTGATDRSVEPGSGLLTLDLTLQPPPPRELRVSVPAIGERELIVTVEGQKAKGAGAATLPAVGLGAHLAVLQTGECPEDAIGCDNAGTCPPGCSSWRGEVVVPAGEGAFAWTAPMRAPVGEVAAPKPPIDAAVVPKEPATPRSSKAVTKGDFAKWLGNNPDWQRDAALAARKADANYLEDWTGTTFPGKASDAVVSVSYEAASAYCRSRGGVATIEANPTAWEESDAAPMHELRAKDGRPSWRRFDGASSESVKPTESNAFMGFRCAR
jgi:serine/threonine protein kinase